MQLRCGGSNRRRQQSRIPYAPGSPSPVFTRRDGPLSYGRVEFMALPDVEVRPWTGMRDAIEIAGPLSTAAKQLFLQMEPSIESFDGA
jgi:hypothetical protein